MPVSRFVYVIHIRTTPDKLWEALTLPEFTRRWWNETSQVSEWKPGVSWKLMTPDGRAADTGEIRVYDPPRKLVLTWQNQFDPEMKAEGHSLLTYDLMPLGEAVKLTVTHEMARDGSKFIDAVSGGWPSLLSSLKSLLETGEALPETMKWPEGY